MNDRYLFDLFGGLELGTFEDDYIEQDVDGFLVRCKRKICNLFHAISNNIKKILAITMGIFAVFAFVFSIIAMISNKKKKMKVVM